MRKRLAVLTKTCAYCTGTYQTKMAAQKYCSDVCAIWACRKRTPLEEMAMYEAWRAGKTLREIGQEHGIGANRVGRICQRYERENLPERRTKKTATHK
jgi:hypothetical protein